MGYKRNEYDWCVMKNDKQCTILWHVDEMNKSHVDLDIVSGVLDEIDLLYGNIEKMTIM